MFGKGREPLLLARLIEGQQCTVLQGSAHIQVKGITESSKKAADGFIFAAKKGSTLNGLDFVQEACGRGASAVVIDQHAVLCAVPAAVTVIAVPDVPLFLSHAAAMFFGNPAEQLKIIAVTGTNGKTTVSHFIGQLLEAKGCRTAVIGTTGVFHSGRQVQTIEEGLTTMPAEQLHAALADCLKQQIGYAVIEASSIGLSSNRLAHCPAAAAVLVNIGVDHYEEHGGKEAYIEAKKKIFDLAERIAVNEEDALCKSLASASGREVRYFNSTEINGESVPRLELPLPGKHNECNARAAVSALQLLGFPAAEILPLLHVLKLPAGRLEKYSADGVDVYIDYAHTPDALQAVLQALQQEGRPIITVFGCGGGRDKSKRPQMGAVAACGSDHLIITSDNPRFEDPSAIIVDILAGTAGISVPLDIIVDRRSAVRHAIQAAQKGDIVLIAGKGHEQTQQTGGETIHFCDREETIKAFRLRSGRPGDAE